MMGYERAFQSRVERLYIPLWGKTKAWTPVGQDSLLEYGKTWLSENQETGDH